MGFKRQLKNRIYCCEICGEPLENHDDKFIYRIDKNDDIKPCNSMVVCHNCQNVELNDLVIYKENVGSIKRYLSLKGKFYRTKRKYEDK